MSSLPFSKSEESNDNGHHQQYTPVKVDISQDEITSTPSQDSLQTSDCWGSLLKRRARPYFTEADDAEFYDVYHDRRVGAVEKDLRRLYDNLKKMHNEEYALAVIFLVRTAVELHRAWHLTLLTKKILNQIKRKFDLNVTFDLGVIHLKFRFEDGLYELHRIVPYDYDSEFQNKFSQISVAVVEGHLTVSEAMNYQDEVNRGEHTPWINWQLRTHYGRCVLYPLEAATCALIFFEGDYFSALIALVTGTAAGLIEAVLTKHGGEVKYATDFLVGVSIGIISMLVYAYNGPYCFKAVFLGTLYWFFYGTAFVIGLLEIIAGELELGVTRFVAVGVKTLMLSMGCVFGMQLVVDNPYEKWVEEDKYCVTAAERYEGQDWLRILWYLACSATALSQYRVPIMDYYRGLIVQFVGYEVQFQVTQAIADNDENYLFNKLFKINGLTSAVISNIAGTAAATITACWLVMFLDSQRYKYFDRILHRHQHKLNRSCWTKFIVKFMTGYVYLCYYLGLANPNDMKQLDLCYALEHEQLHDDAAQDCNGNNDEHPLTSPTLINEKGGGGGNVELTKDQKYLLREAICQSENLNIWAILMPTIYQLVPGSRIALVWFDAIFPRDEYFNVDDGLMIQAGGMAIGMVLGMFVVYGSEWLILDRMSCTSMKVDGSFQYTSERENRRKERLNVFAKSNVDLVSLGSTTGQYSTPPLSPPLSQTLGSIQEEDLSGSSHSDGKCIVRVKRRNHRTNSV